MRFLLFPIFIHTILLSSAHPQEGEEFNPLGRDVPLDQLARQIRLQFEWIEMSHETLTTLLENDETMRVRGHLSSDATPLREEIRNRIEKKEARILETSIVIARSGQRAKVESITEYIYPTEYDPPMTVEGVGKDSETVQLAPQATAFECRNLGVTVEVDPVLGADNRTIDLNMSPEIVYLIDQENYGNFQSEESSVEIVMPRIYTMKTTTQATMIEGEPILIAAQSPFNEQTKRTDPERKVLLFVKADLLLVGLGLPENTEGE